VLGHGQPLSAQLNGVSGHIWQRPATTRMRLMELNGWASPQMLRRYGASARSARARRTYERIMGDNP
jgi:hypothetical protein